MNPATADLYDAFSDELQVAEPALRSYGGLRMFHGPIATLRVFEDNSLVREALEQPGEGRVLVVDGGGSLRCALLGDQLAKLGVDNGWKGVLIHGCLRDVAVVHKLLLGVLALASNPRKSVKRGAGERDVKLEFLGVRWQPGHWLYADDDGVLLAPRELPVAD